VLRHLRKSEYEKPWHSRQGLKYAYGVYARRLS